MFGGDRCGLERGRDHARHSSARATFTSVVRRRDSERKARDDARDGERLEIRNRRLGRRGQRADIISSHRRGVERIHSRRIGRVARRRFQRDESRSSPRREFLG